MMLRVLCTLAILAGLAAAPGAQSFHWEAGRHDHDADHRVGRHLDHLADRISNALERVGERLAWRADRLASRATMAAERAERRAERIRVRVEDRLARRFGTGAWINGADGAGLQALDSADPCAGRDAWNDDRYRFCEVREERLPAGPLAVDAGRNGGIRVEGWDGDGIVVRAVVQTRAETEAEARQLAGQVEVVTGGNRISARGPATSGDRSWSVDYRIQVPRRTDLDLNARNGGITVAGVAGTLRFDTTNGGVRLTDLAGDVAGRTRNGGVTVALGGERWDGAGLDVETSNGGVTVRIPDSYSAQLETRTVNGGFRSNYPLTVTGELSPRRGISATLGSGGPPVKVRTRNGGVSIDRR